MRVQAWSNERGSAASWPAPAPRQPDDGIHTFVWAIWPWVNWLLPILAIICMGNGGWGLLFLLVASPLLVPILALLGSLPRFLLRRAGMRTTPRPVTALLFVQWWAWMTAAITPPGVTDGSPIPAVMQSLTSAPLSGEFLETVMLVSVVIAVSCGVAVLVLAITTSRRLRRTVFMSASGPEASARWTLVAWAVAALLPLLFAATVWVGGIVTVQQRDAAGATVAEVQALSIGVQAQQALERHEQAQGQLSLVRGMIADDDWRVSELGVRPRTDFSEAYDSYNFSLQFEHDSVAEGVIDVDEIGADLLDRGWTEGEYGSFVDPSGNVVEIVEHEFGIRVSLDSPSWWGDAYELSVELGDDSVDVSGRTYAYDEWPPL